VKSQPRGNLRAIASMNSPPGVRACMRADWLARGQA
jgi:hypothetical protein